MSLNLHYDYISKFGILSRDPHAHHDASDLHVSRIIETVVGSEFRKVEVTGEYLLWNGYCWERRDNPSPILDKLADTVAAHVKKINLRLATEKLTLVKEYCVWRNCPNNNTDATVEKIESLINIEKEIYNKLTCRTRTNILNMAASRLILKPEELNQNSDKLVFKNGYYNCKTGEFLPNDRSQNATICIRQEYSDPTEESIKAFDEYLRGLGFDDETLEYLQRSFGYAATGRGSEKRFWWFRGKGDTSKSTLIQIVAECLDQYAMSTLADQWCRNKKQSAGHTEELARLRSVRLVTADEFEKNARFNESLMKKFTSGTGSIAASRKAEKTIEFPITFALFFASNYDCHITEDDTAFINRLNAITFEKRIDPDKIQKDFVKKFLRTGTNRMAVLKWVMEGARKYCESGIGAEPSYVKQSRQKFLDEQNSIAEQLEEILELNDGAVGKKAVTLNAVLEALSQLQKSTRQFSVFTKKEVSSAIKSVFNIELTKSNGHSGFVGLALKNNVTVRQRRPFDPGIDWNGGGGNYDHFDNEFDRNN